MMTRTNLTYIVSYIIKVIKFISLKKYYKKGIAWLSSSYVLTFGI